MKPLKFFSAAVGINLALFIIIYLLPYNPIRSVIGYSTSFFVFIFGLGLKVAVVSTKDACMLATSTGSMGIYQTFYEFLTILSLTIPLYLKDWKKLLEKSAAIFLVMIGYYVVLYGITIIILEKGKDASLLVGFIRYNTESFMIPAFFGLWAFINKNRIASLLREWKTQKRLAFL